MLENSLKLHKNSKQSKRRNRIKYCFDSQTAGREFRITQLHKKNFFFLIEMHQHKLAKDLLTLSKSIAS